LADVAAESVAGVAQDQKRPHLPTTSSVRWTGQLSVLTSSHFIPPSQAPDFIIDSQMARG
jgi:hypothetical protein